MRISRIRHIVTAALAGAGVALSACGGVPVEGKESSAAQLRRAAFEASAVESALRADPACAGTNENFGAVMRDLLERYNTLASSRGMALAWHPDAPEGAVSALVCRGAPVAAYAQGRSVALSEGLLWTLAAAAQARGRYPEDDAAFTRALDEIAAAAHGGAVSLHVTPAGMDGPLFRSALAFVLYHELGHAELGHTREMDDGYGVQAHPEREIQADLFAAWAVDAAGIPPEGAQVVFALMERLEPEGVSGHEEPWRRASAIHLAADGGLSLLLAYP